MTILSFFLIWVPLSAIMGIVIGTLFLACQFPSYVVSNVAVGVFVFLLVAGWMAYQHNPSSFNEAFDLLGRRDCIILDGIRYCRD